MDNYYAKDKKITDKNVKIKALKRIRVWLDVIIDAVSTLRNAPISTIFQNPKQTEDNKMELYDLMKLLEGKNHRFGEVPKITLKLGSRTLSVNHRELSEDGKSVTIFLQAENKEPPSGVAPEWQIDKATKKTQMR